MSVRFRTEIDVNPVERKISHRSHIVTVGSCFSDEVGVRLQDRLFDVAVNPAGTLYNPMSIANALDLMMSGRKYTMDDLVSRDGIWHSFDHHSRFSSADPQVCLRQINEAMETGREALGECTHLFVTFGTAWVYARDGRVVANCHKFPASEFVRSRMSVDDIAGVWVPLLDRLHRFNPELEVVFTVSPIRHLADGAHGNQLSKATLLLAVDAIKGQSEVRTVYFPAYELLLDDLRDYRFYADDMTHPSDVAVDYVYGKLSDMFFDADTVRLAAVAEKLVRFSRHRPLSDDSDSICRHKAQFDQKLESLLAACPDMATAARKLFHNI